MSFSSEVKEELSHVDGHENHCMIAELAAIIGLCGKIKCEDGFISYKYFYDAKEADDLLLVEEWESEEKQQNHLKTEHMKELKELKDKYLLDTKVTKIYT